MIPPLRYNISKLNRLIRNNFYSIRPFTSSNHNTDDLNNNTYSYKDRDRRRMYNHNNKEPPRHHTNPSSRNTRNPNPRIGRDLFPPDHQNPTLTRTRNPTPRMGRDFFPSEEKDLNLTPTRSQNQQLKDGNDFLEKFKLGFDKEGDKKQGQNPKLEEKCNAEDEGTLTPPQGADEIFSKMKKTGLIPNAVAMLDGLCKDGLVQEAMKLFGSMREKGTIPEVVIYTAVVDGFSKAQKLDDAIRIFRKMQSNGIEPNAFSYTVLVQGLCKGKRIEDALGICLEMIEMGHSPNLVTFVGLVDGFCREKGVEEGRVVISTLREKGFVCDEKGVRQYLDKKGPALPLVWEALFGKSNLH